MDAMEPARAEARSEWLEFDANANAVHRAVASARLLETGAVPLRHEQDTLVNLNPLDSGHLSCTQLLLRKNHNGDWDVFLDGRLDEGPSRDRTSVHVLPPFDYDFMLQEDGTNRMVVPPVAVACLVEEGACFPDLVRLQVVQRTFVGGIQIDSGVEPVLSEFDLQPFAVSDPVARFALLSYSMELTAPPSIQLIDRAALRNKRAREARDGLATGIGTLGTMAKKIPPLLTATPQAVATGVLRIAARNTSLRNILFLASLAPTALIAWLRGLDLTGIPQEGQSLNDSLMLGLGVTATGLFVASFKEGRREQGARQQQQQSEKEKEEELERVIRIKFADLHNVVKRLAGYEIGSPYDGPQTSSDLRKLKRFEDAALLEYMNFAYDVGNNALKEALIQRKADIEEMDAADPTKRKVYVEYLQKLNGMDLGTIESPEARAEVAAARARVSTAQGLQEFGADYEQAMLQTLKAIDAFLRAPTGVPNGLDNSGLDFDVLREEARVEFEIRAEIIDAGSDAAQSEPVRSTHVFQSTPAQAKRAAWYAAGYERSYKDLKKVFDDGIAAVENNLLRARSSLIVKGIKPVKFGTALVNSMAGYSQDQTQVDRGIYLELLKKLRADTLEAIEKFRPPEGADANSVPRSGVAPERMRRLPQLCKLQRSLTPSARLVTGDVGIEYSETRDTPLAVASAPLRLAVSNSGQVSTALGRVFAQYVENNGAVRERLRFFIGYETSNGKPLPNAIPLPPDRDVPSISTSLFYAPRMPMDIGEVLTCRTRHARPGADIRVEWLARTPAAHASEYDKARSGNIAEAIGVPATHVGELVAGAYAHILCEDEVRRFNQDAYDPLGQQLMRSSSMTAAERLRRASELAKHVFEADGVPRRLEDDDAFFASFPGGDDLGVALRECAAWRQWRPAWKTRIEDATCEVPTAERLNRLVDAYAAAPRALESLSNFAKALARAKPMPSGGAHDWRALPYMCTQSLAAGDRAAGAAMHIEHAQRALARLTLLSNAIGLPSQQYLGSLQLEAATARPILKRWIRRDPPVASSAWAQLLPGQVGADAFSQTGIPERPTPNSQYDAATLTTLLQNRLQSLSLSDFHDGVRASTPMIKIEDELETSYMVPFGGAVLRELAPTMSRALEEAPVYLALMRSERLGTTAALMGDAGRGFTVTVGALQPSGERHPMHIDWSQSGTEGASLAFSCARMARFRAYVRAELAGPYSTLQSVVSALADVKDGDLGGSVDAANAILWNIERVLQALIIIATHRAPSETSVVISPPSLKPPRKEQPPEETRLSAVDFELKRINRQKRAIVEIISRVTAGGQPDKQAVFKDFEENASGDDITNAEKTIVDNAGNQLQEEVDSYRHYERVESAVRSRRGTIENERAAEVRRYECRNDEREDAHRIVVQRTKRAWPYVVATANALYEALSLRGEFRAVATDDAFDDAFVDACLKENLRAVSLSELCAVLVRRCSQ